MALVLSRKLLESLVVRVPPSLSTTEILVTVVDVDRGKTRLAVGAPREVKIWRMELLNEDGTVTPLPGGKK